MLYMSSVVQLYDTIEESDLSMSTLRHTHRPRRSAEREAADGARRRLGQPRGDARAVETVQTRHGQQLVAGREVGEAHAAGARVGR